MKHVFAVFLLFFTITTNAQVGIGTSTPDASARLQIDANALTNAKGFLPPRVTATQRAGVVSPATGLIVYQTDDSTGFYYYDGTAWKLLTIASKAVPYTGATKSVNLGAYDLTVNGITLGIGAGNVSTNTASGNQTLNSNTTGGYNTASGYQALNANTTGASNTASGYNALYSNTTGNQNIATGYKTLYANTTGNSNIASGYQALYSNTTGSYNIASGSGALRSNTTGSYNIASGYLALANNTTGVENTSSGSLALYSNATGSYNIASGYQALINNTTGSYNIASGYQALYSNTTGSSNTASGSSALRSNTTGSYNIASGYQALFYNTTGYQNTASGYQALYYNTTGYYNTASGYQALYSNTTGNQNTASGDNALSANTTGNNNTALGYNAQASSATVNDEITLGNSSITTLRSQATTITSLSDRRDKTDIIPIVEGLAFLKQLNPVSFTWNTRDKAKVGIKSAGFIAQELLALQKQSNIGDNLDLVSENNPEKLEARYGNLLPVIVKAIQEESAEKDLKIKALNERLDALEKQITQMLNK